MRMRYDYGRTKEIIAKCWIDRRNQPNLQPPIANSLLSIKGLHDFPFESNTKSFFSRFFNDRSSNAVGLTKVMESSNITPLKDIINDIRNIKSDAEIANMRKAGQASGRAFTDAMRQVWTKEKDLAAYLDYKFRTNSCDGSAYVPVAK